MVNVFEGDTVEFVCPNILETITPAFATCQSDGVFAPSEILTSCVQTRKNNFLKRALNKPFKSNYLRAQKKQMFYYRNELQINKSLQVNFFTWHLHR